MIASGALSNNSVTWRRTEDYPVTVNMVLSGID